MVRYIYFFSADWVLIAWLVICDHIAQESLQPTFILH